MQDIIPAGVSDKYGQVYVEKIGNTGFDDLTEPVAVFRAQDVYAVGVLEAYLELLRIDDHIDPEQIFSVEHQLEAFNAWRLDNSDKVRLPGRPRGG